MKNNKTTNKKFHPRSKHLDKYDFAALIGSSPNLASFVIKNKMGNESIDFFNPEAVKALNKALLLHHYKIIDWDLPATYLCPPIPSRADYLHHVADLLAQSNKGKIPRGEKVLCLDVGVGANCIYPLIGSSTYAWNFIGSDIDAIALKIAQNNIDFNPNLKPKIELRLQQNKQNIFKGILEKGELIDLTVCNPPFHASAKEAEVGSVRKLKNLKKEKLIKTELNFGGRSNELWCEGGESAFVYQMILESKELANSCFWFTTLISKEKNLKAAYTNLEKVGAKEVKTINMQHGNKTSRILAWTFLSKDLQQKWAGFKWI